MFLDDDKFILSRIKEQWEADISVQLYQIDSEHSKFEPHNLATFLFPPIGDHVAAEETSCISRPMHMTASSITSAQSHISEQLCQITFSVFPSENDIMHTYCFFIYPGALLSVLGSKQYDGAARQFSWNSWGAKNSACFISELGITPMVDEWYVRGDRVLVVDRKDHEGNGIYNWNLRVLDFNPVRVRRARLVSQGHSVWPPPPSLPNSESSINMPTPKRVQDSEDSHMDWNMYAFKKRPIRCDLPYTESILIEELEANDLEAQMDDEHIILNKVGQLYCVYVW